MKKSALKILVVAISLLFMAKVNAQSYSLTSGNVFTINMGLNNVQFDGLEWTNISSQILVLNWQTIEIDTVPGSSFHLCASGECYIGMPDTGSYFYFPTLPGQIGWMKFHIWTGSTPGVSKLRAYIYEASAPNSGDTLTFIVNINQANGIEQNKSNESFAVYPNPADEKLIIDFAQYSFDELIDVSILNELGQLVHSDKISKAEKNKVNTSFLANGMYIVQFTNHKKEIIQIKKIIINHK